MFPPDRIAGGLELVGWVAFDAADALLAPGSDDRGGDAFELLGRAVVTHPLHVHSGSIGERDGDRPLNTSPPFNPASRLVARYSKIHLFDIVPPDGVGYRESDLISRLLRHGDHDHERTVGTLRIGLVTRYDLRFAELFNRLHVGGAELIVLPVALPPRPARPIGSSRCVRDRDAKLVRRRRRRRHPS